MTPAQLGSVIGAGFGLVFVLVNSGSLPSGAAVSLRVVAGLALVAVLLAVLGVGPHRTATGADRRPGGGFTRGYWLVVMAEVLAIAAGLVVLHGPLHAPQAAVAWIALVVGVHFNALAVVWRLPLFHGLAVPLVGCGVIGLLLAAVGAPVSAIDVVGGIAPGFVLLGFALWGATQGAATVPRVGG